MPVPPAQMRALVFDGPAADTRTSRVAQLCIPEPAPGSLLIDVKYAGVNFKDVMARRGDPGYVRSWPFVPGLEVAGTIRRTGEGVEGFAEGDRVAAFTDSGGLAEVALAPAELTIKVPDSLDLQVAAAAPGALTTAALLLHDFGHLGTGEIVLVHSAAGGVGRAAAQLARLASAGLVLGTVGSTTRARAAREAGYDAIFVRGPDLVTEIGEYADAGLDLILDPQGTTVLAQDLQLATAGGRIIVFGNASGAALDSLPPMSQLFAGNVAIGGFSLAALAAAAPARLLGALARVFGHLAKNELEVEITRIDGLDQAPEAQQALAEGRGRGKQIVRVA